MQLFPILLPAQKAAHHQSGLPGPPRPHGTSEMVFGTHISTNAPHAVGPVFTRVLYTVHSIKSTASFLVEKTAVCIFKGDSSLPCRVCHSAVSPWLARGLAFLSHESRALQPSCFSLPDICSRFPLVPSCATRANQQEGGVLQCPVNWEIG